MNTFFAIIAATVRDISFWTGLVTIFAFAQGRFNEKQFDEENIDPPLPARYFTSRFRYYSSALVFAGVYVFIYVTLIVIGSTPALQGPLKTLFGSLSDTALPNDATSSDAAAKIGTPAWAAMVLMVVAPAWPVVRRLETRFRYWLQEFSDTPFKARGLADEIIQAVSPDGTTTRLEKATKPTLVAIFDQLKALGDELTARGGSRSNQRYSEFFRTNGEILSKTVTQFRAIQNEIARLSVSPSEEEESQPTAEPRVAPPTYRMQMAVLVRRLARLIACALFFAESEEYPVRERLRTVQIGRLADIPRAGFQFTRAQVIVGLFVIVVSTLILGPLSAIIVNILVLDAQLTPYFMIAIIRTWSFWAMKLAAAFILPLSLAAAIRLYLIDRAAYEPAGLTLSESLTTLILAFIGCFGVSALPFVALDAYQAGPSFQTTALTISLLWVVPLAIVNAAFVILPGSRRERTALHNAGLDFAIFALLGGVAAAGASALQVIAQLSARENLDEFGLYFVFQIPFIITVAIVGGLNGSLQCAASRVVQSQTPVPTAAEVHARSETVSLRP